MRLHRKDLKNALEAAETLGLNLPMTVMVQQMLDELIALDKGEEDHGGIVQALERANHAEIHSVQ